MQARILQRVVQPFKYSHRCFATYKTSTGLVGLPVQPEGDHVLINISNEALTKLQVCSFNLLALIILIAYDVYGWIIIRVSHLVLNTVFKWKRC